MWKWLPFGSHDSLLKETFYNNITWEIEEQSVFSLEYRIPEGYDDGEVSFSVTPLNMAKILSFKKISDGSQGVTIGSSDRFGGE